MSVSSEPASAPGRSRAATRERLLAAAIDLLADGGLHGVTSHDIARRAGVASGTFYLYFRDKAEIHREILFSALFELRSRSGQALRGADGPRAAAEARARALVEFATEHRAVVRILFRKDIQAGDAESDVLSDIATNMTARLRNDQAKGWFTLDLEPEIAAQAIVGMTTRLIDWWTEDPSRASAEQVISTLVHIQQSGTFAVKHSTDDAATHN